MPTSTESTPRPSNASGTDVAPLPGRDWEQWLTRYAGVLLLIAMVVFLTIALPGKFMDSDNLIGLVSNQSVAAIVALGLLFPLAAGAFDISISGAITLGVVIIMWLFQVTEGSMPIVAAIALTLSIALVIGAVNAFLVVRVGVDPFIATIGTSSVLLGLSEVVANGTTISQNIPSSFTSLGRADVLGIPLPVIYVVVLAAVLWYVLELTPLGRQLYATGAGGEAARLAGVRTNRIMTIAFFVSALCAVLAAIVYAARLGAAPPNTGASFLLPAYASAFLGSTMITPGRFNVAGLIIAVLIVAVGINGLQLAGTPFWIINIYQGAVLIVAVMLARLRAKRG